MVNFEGCKNGTERSLCETTRKGAITTSVNPIINKTVSSITHEKFSH